MNAVQTFYRELFHMIFQNLNSAYVRQTIRKYVDVVVRGNNKAIHSNVELHSEMSILKLILLNFNIRRTGETMRLSLLIRLS